MVATILSVNKDNGAPQFCIWIFVKLSTLTKPRPDLVVHNITMKPTMAMSCLLVTKHNPEALSKYEGETNSNTVLLGFAGRLFHTDTAGEHCYLLLLHIPWIAQRMESTREATGAAGVQQRG